MTTPRRKPKTPVRFRQREIERAVRSAQHIGLTVQRIDLDPASGKISLVRNCRTGFDQIHNQLLA